MIRQTGLLVLTTILTAGLAMADPPSWDEFPMECARENGVCFHFYETNSLTGTDFDGEVLLVSLDGDGNDWMRQNTDGTYFLHIVNQRDNTAAYCPPGVSIPDECWPSVEPIKITVTGIVNLDSNTGVFAPACPFSAHARGIVENPAGDLFTTSTLFNIVKNPDDSCTIVSLEIQAIPAPNAQSAEAVPESDATTDLHHLQRR